MTPDQEREVGQCIFREVSDGLLLIEPATLRVLEANPAAQRLTGRSRKTLVGVAFPELFTGADPAILARLVQACQSTSCDTGADDLILQPPDREERRVQVHVSRLHPSGGAIGLLVLRDVTRQRRAELALRDSEARFRRLAEQARVVPWEADEEAGRLTYVGPQAEALFGYPATDWYAPNFWADHLHADDRARILRTHAEAAGWRDDYSLEYRFVAAGGRIVWVHEIVHVSVAADGSRRLQGFLFDVTAQKRLEEQLRRATKLEAVGRLAGGVAHDFNNLLTAILGCSDLVRSRLPEGDHGRQLLERINDAAGRAAGLVRQLLAFGRRQMYRPSLLDLNDVIRDALPAVQHLVGDAIEVSFSSTTPLPRVRADAGQLEQVLLTLVANARDAMPDGGRLSLETTETTMPDQDMGSHTLRSGRYVLLRVQDTGEGMDDAILSQLFEPYFTTKEVGQGRGLGLAMVYGAVKQSGGYIYAVSEPKCGACFTLYLPAVEEPAVPTVTASVPSELSGTETVLVVEDEAAVRLLLRTLLEAQGYTVLTASDGVEGWEEFQRHASEIHLLLSDIAMPRMDGAALAAEVRRRWPTTPILLISGYAPESLALSVPGAAFLAKPFVPIDLLVKVRMVLDAARSSASPQSAAH